MAEWLVFYNKGNATMYEILLLTEVFLLRILKCISYKIFENFSQLTLY